MSESNPTPPQESPSPDALETLRRLMPSDQTERRKAFSALLWALSEDPTRRGAR